MTSSPRASDDNDSIEYYPSGARASVFKADGSGFIYYPSGHVAVCKGVVDGRGRYYLYGDDPKSTPLGAVDEHAVGFFLGPAGVRLALSKVGGLMTDKHGYIAKEWRYDLGAHMPPPTGIVEVKLNRSMSFEFLDRGDMRIKFSREGISHELDAGVRPKREGTYLDNSVRLPGGRLEPQLNRVSLVSRQQAFGNAMKAKRDRLKPQSRNLDGDYKSLVAGLEKGFDGMDSKVEPFPDPTWKKNALVSTCRELPRIRCTGQEVGPFHGLGSTIYSDEDDRVDNTCRGSGVRRSRSWGQGVVNHVGEGPGGGATKGESDYVNAATARLRKDGKWLGELDVRLQLLSENPLLKRSSFLQAASGRYAEEIVIPGGKTSVCNPTGKTTVSGAPLRMVPAARLQVFLEEEAGPDQLVVVLGVRGDDPICNKVQTAAELTNRFLLQRYGSDEDGGSSRAAEGTGGGGAGHSIVGKPNHTTVVSFSHASRSSSSSSSSTAVKYRMVKVNFAEHQATAEMYGVKALPAFLMFRGGRLAWAGTLGGSPVKAAPPDSQATRQRVLLVEPCAKAQLTTERALRKFGCTWDLVLDASQALSRIQMARTNAMASEPSATLAGAGGGGYGVLMISDALGATEVIALEKAFHGVAGYGGDSVVVGLAHVKGDPSDVSAVALRVVSDGFAEESHRKRAVLSSHLALVADMAVTKPVRASALKAVFGFCKRRKDEAAARGVAHGATWGGGEGKRSDGKGKTLSMSASCSTLEGGDGRYKGVTPSRLLETMEEVEAQVAMGIFMSKRAAGAGRHHRPGGVSTGEGEILVSAQETSCRGYMLERSTLQHIATI